jgi:hypothetical protein
VGWFAEANGEEVTLPNGDSWCPQPGSIIQLGELYGSEKIGTNKGVKKGAKAIAQEIRAYEDELKLGGWVSGFIHDGPADNQIRNVIESDKDTIEKTFQDNKVSWESSDKSPGSRINGLQLFRDRLTASIRGEGSGFYFMDNCRASIATIPVLPRDEKKPDDVDTSAEDHAWDMVRYRVLKGNLRGATVIKVNFPR